MYGLWERLSSVSAYVSEGLFSPASLTISSVSLDPEKSPQLLSTDTELVIAPKTRKKQTEPAKVIATQGPTTTTARLLPALDYRSTFSKYENPSSVVLVSPQTLGALNLQKGQQIYLQKIQPPVHNLIKEIKHLQQNQIVASPKDIALQRLRDEPPKKDDLSTVDGEDPPSFTLEPLDIIPPNHVGLLDYPDGRSWDIIRCDGPSETTIH